MNFELNLKIGDFTLTAVSREKEISIEAWGKVGVDIDVVSKIPAGSPPNLILLTVFDVLDKALAVTRNDEDQP